MHPESKTSSQGFRNKPQQVKVFYRLNFPFNLGTKDQKNSLLNIYR